MQRHRWWATHDIRGSMFCRRGHGTHAPIKPSHQVAESDSPRRFRSRLILSFHCPHTSVQPDGLGGVLKIEREAAHGIVFWRLHRREIVCFARCETTTQTLVVTQVLHRGIRRPTPRPGNASARAATLCARWSLGCHSSRLTRGRAAASAGHSSCSGTGKNLFMGSGAGDRRGTALRRCVCKHGWLAHRRFPCRPCVAASWHRVLAGAEFQGACRCRVNFPRARRVDGAAVIVFRLPPAFQSACITLSQASRKQRLSAFSRRGPSFWPLDRCRPS
ncbi:hypothetical protein BKA66DRAFT_322548 [Pyrenochaeta sp. MPI-SDFR-AT-0127]|nr:hypothetical protein BKA66DRAFT_322548 [Pyrenochaeta sp. MPI-SDFR-AT-0127]